MNEEKKSEKRKSYFFVICVFQSPRERKLNKKKKDLTFTQKRITYSSIIERKTIK